MIHDMATPSDLAERRAEVTREAISEAVVALLIRTHPSNISVPDVAREAGVSVRTVYRYFPNRAALIDHVSGQVYDALEQAGAGDGAAALYDDPARWVPRLWHRFGDQIDLLRAQQMAPAGAELRARRLGRNRAHGSTVLADRYPDAGDDDLAKLTDLQIAVTSSRMFLELHDRMGWSVEEAGELSVWLLKAITREYEDRGFR